MGDVIRTEFGQVFEDDDGFEIEVSDLRTGSVSSRDAWRLSNGKGLYTEPADTTPDIPDVPEEGPAAGARFHHSPFAPYLSRRQRASRVAVSVGVVVAAFLAITLIFAPFLYAGLQPPAAQSLGRNADRFYFVPNIPWGRVVLDGNRLTRLPEVGSAQPLHLAPGRHSLEWLADPFVPFHCTLSVPHSNTDTCATEPLIDSSGAFTGTLITEHESLLAVNLDQLLPLRGAIQGAIRDATATATVEPGEHYRHPFKLGDLQSGKVVVADQALKATMSFVPMLQTGLSELCSMYPSQSEILPLCRAPGQDCRELCTLSQPRGVYGRSNDWLAAISARILWSYTTPDAKVAEQDAATYGFDLTLIVLRITWNGAEWHVTPVIGDRSHLAAASDASCGSAREWLIDGIEENQLKSDVPTIANGFYSSTANAATGCVVMLPPSTNTNSTFPSSPLQAEMPIFLGRFGVLLAANDAAHALWPELPQVTPHEGLIAEALSHGWG
ncbi:MAG: hypothetical protein ACXWQ5_22555 [Ktedonobacterales bacterium]